jgi:flagellar motor switch protein FliG
MTRTNTHIRKAAVLIRSLDGETAARLLAELSPDEVAAVRRAIAELGDIDSEERADIAAEFRHAGSAAAQNRQRAVELEISSLRQKEGGASVASDPREHASYGPLFTTNMAAPAPFAFLENTKPSDLASHLAGEHPQVVAVVLSFLDARRAAELLDALPYAFQPEVLERLAELGDTDPETLLTLERELAAWVDRQPKQIRSDTKRGDHAARILAAARPARRAGLLEQLRGRNRRLALRLSASADRAQPTPQVALDDTATHKLPAAMRSDEASRDIPDASPPAFAKPVEPAAPIPPTWRALRFEELTMLDSATLSRVFRDVEPHVLRLALVGANESLVDRMARQLPKPVARQFRRSLNELGPTRLSDVAAAQQMVADSAGRIVHQQRPTLSAAY